MLLQRAVGTAIKLVRGASGVVGLIHGHPRRGNVQPRPVGWLHVVKDLIKSLVEAPWDDEGLPCPLSEIEIA